MGNHLVIFIYLFVVVLVVSCSDDNKNETHDDVIGQTQGCKKSDYLQASKSEYILPYLVDESYPVVQGNCDLYSHKKSAVLNGHNVGDLRYAYDFGLPVDAKVIATRSGKVFNVIDKNPNYIANLSTTNFILIQHSDKTLARYIHLTQDGALVEIGDEVSQGDIIGISGSSGVSLPHLHFDVFEEDSITCTMGNESYNAAGGIMIEHGCKTIPITFRNSEPLDTPLLRSKSYRAMNVDAE